MLRSRRQRRTADPSYLLNTTGEIAIGERARRERRQRIAIALFGLLLVGLAGVVYWASLPATPARPAGTYTVVVRCVRCGTESVAQVSLANESYPLPCPHCGERGCHKLWVCRLCGERFLLAGDASELACPNCRSQSVGTAKPAQPTERMP